MDKATETAPNPKPDFNVLTNLQPDPATFSKVRYELEFPGIAASAERPAMEAMEFGSWYRTAPQGQTHEEVAAELLAHWKETDDFLRMGEDIRAVEWSVSIHPEGGRYPCALDFYRAPESQNAEEWHRERLLKAFSMYLPDTYSVNEVQRQVLAGDSGLQLKIVGHEECDYRRYWLVGTLWQHGSPFMVLGVAGREGDDEELIAVTDEDRFFAALEEICELLPADQQAEARKQLEAVRADPRHAHTRRFRMQQFNRRRIQLLREQGLIRQGQSDLGDQAAHWEKLLEHGLIEEDETFDAMDERSREQVRLLANVADLYSDSDEQPALWMSAIRCHQGLGHIYGQDLGELLGIG